MSAAHRLGRRAVSGTFWVAGSTYVGFVLNFVTNVWLMRLLAPDLFGIFALALFFLGIFKKVGAFGFNYALVHRQDDLERAVPTHLFLHLSASALSVLLILVAAPLLTPRYGSQMTTALIVMALFSVFEDASNTPRIVLEKELAFRQVSLLSMGNTLATSVLSIGIAYAGGGIWAIVARQAVNVVIGFIGYWAMSPVPFRVRFDREMIRWYIRFGAYIWVSGIATYLILEFDDFLVGTIAGSLALGFYNRAYRFSTLPTDVIGSVVGRVAFPIYSKLQNDRERLSLAVHLILRALSVLCLPASVLLVLVAPQFTRILLGETWMPMVPLLQLLVVYSMLRPLYNATGELFAAVGSPRTSGLIQLAQAVLSVAACPFAVWKFGATGAAVVAGVVMTLGVVLAYTVAGRWIDVRYGKVFGVPALAAVVGALATLEAERFLDRGMPWLDLLSRSAVFLAVFAAILLPIEGRSLFEEFRYLRSQWEVGPVEGQEAGFGV